MAAAHGQIVSLEERAITATDDEVQAYAEWLGLDREFERDLFVLAKVGLEETLPEGWQACKVVGQDDIFYWHAASQTSTWDHPLDKVNKGRVEAAREERRCFVVTLSVVETDEGMEVIGTSIAGEEVARAECLPTDVYGDLEDTLKASVQGADGMVLCFATANGSLIGYSARARAVRHVVQ